MVLNEFLAQCKRELFEDITKGSGLRLGQYDSALLKELRAKGEPQIGTAVLQPRLIVFEFLFKFPDGQVSVLPVEVVPQERIVYLPVPDWVIESIWQGEVSGSYHFESDARSLLERFASVLEPEANAEAFGSHKSIGRH